MMFPSIEPPAPPQPGLAEQVERLQQESIAMEIEHRRAMLAWAPVFCTCVPGWVRVDVETPPGHARCLIHGQLVIDPRTGQVIA